MQLVLVMFSAEGEHRSFSIVRDMTVVGRREDCDLCIPVGDVSRKHCRLVKTEDSVRIEDLGSSNGTYVNGQRIQESNLNPGDWIQVGPVQFCVQIDGMPSDEELAQRSVGEAEETTAGLALDPDAPVEEASPEASHAGVMIPADSLETPGAELEDVGEEVPLEEVDLADAPLEEVSEEDGGAVDAADLEEIVEGAELEEDPDAPSEKRRGH